jgi:hypothetical protein
MAIKIMSIQVCEEINSLEMVILIFVPMLMLLTFYANGYDIGLFNLLISVSVAVAMFILITIVKNILAKLIDTESICKIPHFPK